VAERRGRMIVWCNLSDLQRLDIVAQYHTFPCPTPPGEEIWEKELDN
jgi:hypothetical protein